MFYWFHFNLKFLVFIEMMSWINAQMRVHSTLKIKFLKKNMINISADFPTCTVWVKTHLQLSAFNFELVTQLKFNELRFLRQLGELEFLSTFLRRTCIIQKGRICLSNNVWLCAELRMDSWTPGYWGQSRLKFLS